MRSRTKTAGMMVAATLAAGLFATAGWAQTVTTTTTTVPGTPCTAVVVPPPATVTVVNQHPQVVITATTTSRAQTGPTPTILDAIAFPNAQLVGSAIPAPGTAPQPVVICQQTPGQLPPYPVYPYAPGYGYSVGYGYGYGSLSTSVTPTPDGYGGVAQPAPPAAPVVTNATVPHNTIRDLALSPDRFDRQVVTVTGVVAAVHAATTADGTAYTALTLRDGDAAVAVLVWGRSALAVGDAVRVSGSFYDGPPPGLGTASSSLPWVQADAVASVAHP
ncbi:MAG TPA: hypothetical protein VK587_02420 [bacterium]|nr:hypothetical protein [bacterium]